MSTSHDAAVPVTARTPSWRATWARYGIVVSALLMLSLLFQGARPLWEPDEGRYSNIALEMVRLDDFVNPRLSLEVTHFAKPPLTYWAIAASVAAFGHSELAVRLPNALAFVLTVLLVWRMGRWLVPKRPWLPALVYGSFLLPYGAANFVTTDTLLTLFEALAMCGFVEARFGPPSHRRRGLLVMWVGFGLAFLTKGPPGLLPLLAVIAFEALAPRQRSGSPGDRARAVARLVTPAGLLAFVAIGLTWYVVAVLLHPELLGYFLGNELYGRLFTTAHDRNPEWYGALSVYLPTLLVGGLPWTPFAGAAAVGFLRRTGRSWWRELRNGDPERLLLVLWFVLPLGVLALARSRLPLYALPLFVPLALVAARRVDRRPAWRPVTVAAVALWIVAMVGLRAGIARVPSKRDARATAAAVVSAVEGPVDEVLLVGSRSGYGLSFYLGCEVEPVALSEDEARAHLPDPVQTLADELGEPEGRRAFLVPTHRAAEFERELLLLAIPIRHRGAIHDLAIYTPVADG